MAERMVSLREADVKEMVKFFERMIGFWTSSGTEPHRICCFCYHSEDVRGRLNHSQNCRGNPLISLLKKKLEELGNEMDVIRIAELMDSDDVDPATGIAAIQWLANVCNHGMETRTMLRAIRSFKDKLRIPF